jgi:hypothetical protein
MVLGNINERRSPK